MLYTDIMFMFISSKNINGTQKMDVSQPYCVFNYCTTADHKSHYSSLSARISCVEISSSCFSCLSLACRREKTVFPRIPAKPVRRSGPGLPVEWQSHCLAAAKTLQECRSLLRSAGQIHRVLRQVVHHCVAGRGHSYTCCSVCQLSCQMWKCRRQDLQLSFSK